MERSWLLTVTTESMESIVLTMVMGQTGLMGLMGLVVVVAVAVTVAVAVAAGAVVVTVGAATVETTHALSLRHTIPHHDTITHHHPIIQLPVIITQFPITIIQSPVVIIQLPITIIQSPVVIIQLPIIKRSPINIQFPVTTRFHIIILSLSKVRLRRDICVTTPVSGHQFYPDFATCLGNTLVTIL